MAYVKIIYQDSPSTATPLNAQNLNHMDDGIAENDRRLNELAIHNAKSFNGREGDIVSATGDYDITQIAPTTGATVGQIPILTNVGTEEEPVLEFQMQDVPSSGHVIQNTSGTDMAQEEAMQFLDSHVTDDSVNGRTVVETFKAVTEAEYSSETEDGAYIITDGDGATIEPANEDYVEVTADGVKTVRQLLDALFTLIDTNKVSKDSTLVAGIEVFRFQKTYGTGYMFSHVIGDVTFARISACIFKSTDSRVLEWKIKANGTTVDEISITWIPDSGDKFTLYYGNKKATVDLQTTANRCWYDSNTTVKQKIDTKANLYRTTTSLPSTSAGATATITIPFTATLIYNVQITAINSGLPFIASNYWADGTNLHIQVYAINATSGETVMVNVTYK